MINKRFVLTALVCAFASSQGFSADIAVGWQSSYALLSDGTVKAWGKNGEDGRLGFGNNTPYSYFSTPTNVTWSDGSLLTNVVSVTGGRQHALALLNDGTVVAWGDNEAGALGIGNYQDKSNATAVMNITGASQISAGWGWSMALLSNGLVYAWGDNTYSQLGSAVSTLRTNTPFQVLGLSNIIQIAAGTKHAFALQSNRTLLAWGEGVYGKLGNGTNLNLDTPVPVLSNVVTMAAAVDHSLAVTTDGKVWAWGNGEYGRLGTGGYDNEWLPRLVVNATNTEATACLDITVDTTIETNVSSVFPSSEVVSNCFRASGIFSTTITTNYCTNYYYYTCTNTFTLQNNVVAVAAGRDFSLALDSNNRVWSWGRHIVGELGIGGDSSGSQTTPVRVRDITGTGYLTNVVSIVAAKHMNGAELTSTHAMARLGNGTIVGWGDNRLGQLGVSTNVVLESTIPRTIPLP